jgi:hypothetical protein
VRWCSKEEARGNNRHESVHTLQARACDQRERRDTEMRDRERQKDRENERGRETQRQREKQRAAAAHTHIAETQSVCGKGSELKSDRARLDA